VGLFGVVTGFLANAFIPDNDDDASGDAPNLGTILAEIQKLQAAQEQSSQQMQVRLAAVETQLKTQSEQSS